MKILHVVSSMEYGGGPMHVLTLAKGLCAHGIESVVAGPDGPMRAQFEAAGITVLPWGAAGRAGADICHTHGKLAGVFGRLYATLRRLPAVHTFHGLHYDGYGPLKRRAYFMLERWLARRTAAIIHLTDAQAAEAVHVGLPGGQVIPNGIEAERIEADALSRTSARAVLDFPPHAYIVGTIARLDPVKRTERLIAALTHLPDVHLAIIGDGAERAVLEAMVVGRSLVDRVHFLGAMPRAAAYLRAFDVFVSASAREGLPLALLEAMACGLPVVVSDIPAHLTVLGQSTQVSDDLVRMVTWLRGNPTVAADLGSCNRRTVVAFDARRMVEQTVAVYREITMRPYEDIMILTQRRPASLARRDGTVVATGRCRPVVARRGELPAPEWYD